MTNQPTILVSPVGFDDVNAVLQQLGGFGNTRQLEEHETHLLQDANFLSQFEHLFLNCHQRFGECIAPHDVDAIRDFVENGGALYASDWASSVVEAAFGQRAAFARRVGQQEVVTALVRDPYLSLSVGSSVSITFDMSQWDVIRKFPAWTDVYLWDSLKRPLAVGFRMGKGRIVFTSFHHHAQQAAAQQFSSDAEKILQWLVALPTQHGRILSVANTLGQHRTSGSYHPVVSRIGAQPQSIPLILGSKAGLGVFAVSWQPSEGVFFSMRYLRGGETVEAEQQSSFPPILLTVRNPSDDDAVEIRRSASAESRDEPEGTQLYVLGIDIRRDLLGDPDWLALAVLRHIKNRLERGNTLAAARSLVTDARMFDILNSILSGLGYTTARRPTGDRHDEGSEIIAGIAGVELDNPELSAVIRIIDRTSGREGQTLQSGASGAYSPTPVETAVGTERLALCAILSERDVSELSDMPGGVDSIIPPAEFHDWKLIASEQMSLDHSEETVSAEEFSTAYHLQVAVYRL
jgi:hypothetical protein